MNRRTFSGRFDLVGADGACRLIGRDTVSLEIVMLGVEPGIVSIYGLERVTIEWDGAGGLARFERGGKTSTLVARSLLVHEPCPAVFAELPLAKYDARAQRFWRWIFRLARLPGGLAILRLLGRHARA